MARRTRAEHFAEADKALRRADMVAAFMLFSLGIVSPLVDPIPDMVDRWRRS